MQCGSVVSLYTAPFSMAAPPPAAELRENRKQKGEAGGRGGKGKGRKGKGKAEAVPPGRRPAASPERSPAGLPQGPGPVPGLA